MASISGYINKIKTAIYGKDVRGSLADGLDAVNKETEAAATLSNETKNKQTALEKKYDDQISNMTNENPSISELVDFRTSMVTGKSYETAGKRADDIDTKLIDTENKLTAPNTNYLYVDALKSDSNNGLTEGTAVRTLKKAFDLLYQMGSKPSFGSWTIKVKGYGNEHTYPACRVANMPYFNQKLTIEGDVDANGEPTTVFKQDPLQGGSYYIGMWIEPGVRNLNVKNITFENFSNGFNGYGFLMKNQGYVLLENCRAYNCDCGFAGINNVTITTWRCIAIDCLDIGFKALYSSNAMFGAGYGGGLFDHGGNGCKAINCSKGVFLSRNAVGHVDYMNIEDCTYAGVHVEMASRVHVVGTHFKRNDFGVRAEGTGEWVNNTDEPNYFYMDSTTEKNRIIFGHFGSSRESRMHSQTATNEYRISVKSTDVEKIGDARETIWRGSDLGKIPAYWFVSPAKRIRIVIHGTNVGSASKTLIMYTNDMNATNSAAIAASSVSKQGIFITEFTIYPLGDNVQKQVTHTQYAYDIPAIGVFNRSMSTDIDRLFHLTAEMTNSTAADKITIHSLEIFFMG